MNKVDIFYIGHPKSGSTWFFQLLKSHPGVFVPAVKDLNFFNERFHKGVEWYHSYFASARNDQSRVDVSHDYIQDAAAAERIYTYNRSAKIIVFVREPTERFRSGLGQRLRNGRKVKSHEAFWNEIEWKYKTFELMKPYYRLFPVEQILVLDFKDLKADPVEFAARIFDFIGVEHLACEEQLGKKQNRRLESRWPLLTLLLRRVYLCLKAINLLKLTAAIKRSGLCRRFVFREPSQEIKLDEEMRRKIIASCRKDAELLEQIVKHDFVDSWWGRD